MTVDSSEHDGKGTSVKARQQTVVTLLHAVPVTAAAASS